MQNFSHSLLTATLLAAGSTALAQQQKPNIILILTDDQGYGDFAFTGNPYVKTPNLDKLRNSGVLFDNFHVSALSAPTRAALMTGRYAYRTGVTGVNRSKVNMYPEENTIPEYLKGAGYNTAMFGKWHLGYNYPMRPIDQGFDEYNAWEEMQFRRTDPIMEVNGVNIQYKGRFLTDVIFENATSYIEKKSKESNPFFVYLATYLPHTHGDGKQVPDEYMKRFEKYTELSWHTKQTYAMVEKVDEQIGLLLNKINQLGIADNTIIIFGSDNGPATCYYGQENDCQERYRAGFRGNKGDVYEGGIRTPFIFMWKNKVQSGTVQHRFSAHVDILPTILDIVGLKPSDSQKPDGNSLYPLLTNKNSTIPDTRYFYHMRSQDMNIMENEWKNSCYVENGFKLVNGKELYDLNNDPSEQNDLSAGQTSKVEDLRKKYDAFLREQLAIHNLQYQPNIIGSDKQEVVNLMYYERVKEQDGWPVEVIKKGKYKITIRDIQVNDIAEGASFIVQANEKEWKLPINKNCTELIFDKLDLPLGNYFLKIKIDGDHFPKKFSKWTPQQGRYHAEEWGHRLITVEPIKRKNPYTFPSSIKLYDGLLD